MQAFSVFLLIFVLVVLVYIESSDGRRHGKNRHRPGYRRRVINNDDWNDEDDDGDMFDFHPRYRRPYR